MIFSINFLADNFNTIKYIFCIFAKSYDNMNRAFANAISVIV